MRIKKNPSSSTYCGCNIDAKMPFKTMSRILKNGLFDVLIILNIIGKKGKLALHNFHNPLVFPESPVPLEFTPFLGILVGVVLTLVLVAFVVILILRIKYQQSHHNRHPSGWLTISIFLFPKNRIENIF